MTRASSNLTLHDRRYSQSLERGLVILTCFTAKRPEMGIAEIADELGMSRSTTHRYASTLAALGYLEQDASRKYRLGLRVTDLGITAMSAIGLREHARNCIGELRDRTGYTTALAVLDGTDILYIDRLLGAHGTQSKVQLRLQAGSRLPAYCTAMGKLLLASVPANGHRELLSAVRLQKRGPNTITSKKALQRELQEVVAAGFAVNDEELAPELLAVAAPVRNGGGDVIAAVSLSAHRSGIALGELVDALGPHLVSMADRISARLGYRRADERR
jgi:IclR family pca regulon transcriptional regulator